VSKNVNKTCVCLRKVVHAKRAPLWGLGAGVNGILDPECVLKNEDRRKGCRVYLKNSWVFVCDNLVRATRLQSYKPLSVVCCYSDASTEHILWYRAYPRHMLLFSPFPLFCHTVAAFRAQGTRNARIHRSMVRFKSVEYRVRQTRPFVTEVSRIVSDSRC
jgi:hypothetical protein